MYSKSTSQNSELAECQGPAEDTSLLRGDKRFQFGISGLRVDGQKMV